MKQFFYSGTLLTLLVFALQPTSAEANAGLYQHCDFGGYQALLTEGRYTLEQLQAIGIQNDDLSSVLVVPGWRVRLFEHDNFQGREVTLDSEAACLVDSNFNDAVSSVEVVRIGGAGTSSTTTTVTTTENGITTSTTTTQTTGIAPAMAPAVPVPPAALATAAGSVSSQAGVQALLSAHNSYRAKHGAPALTWSASLAADAQNWANQCVWQHAPFAARNGAGENLASWSGGGHSANYAAQMWYDEIKDYDYARQGFSGATGHFTQVVWNGSRELGCGASTCPGIGEFIVCRYFPSGNMMGSFPGNVNPAR